MDLVIDLLEQIMIGATVRLWARQRLWEINQALADDRRPLLVQITLVLDPLGKAVIPCLDRAQKESA